jgi:hypothetical protein
VFLCVGDFAAVEVRAKVVTGELNLTYPMPPRYTASATGVSLNASYPAANCLQPKEALPAVSTSTLPY